MASKKHKQYEDKLEKQDEKRVEKKKLDTYISNLEGHGK
jgi:hypothetical protein